MWIALAFLALLVSVVVGFIMAPTEDSSSNAVVQSRVTGELTTQGNLIRQQVLSCTLRFPVAGLPVVGHPPAWPAQPPSGLVRDVSCPGNANENLWLGNGSVFLPAPPTEWSEWQYLKDADGICIRTTANPGMAADPVVIAAVQAAAGKWGHGETFVKTAGSLSITLWLRKINEAGACVS